jgi:predicted MFS family arabinose efflux permease
MNSDINKLSITKKMALVLWLVTAIFYAYQYILRVMPNIMMDDIVQQFNIDIKTFGQFSGIYYIGYSLMHLPLGIMLDRYGPKKIIPSCILLTVAGLLPIIFTKYWLYPIIGRLLIGIGSSAAILGTFKVVRLCFKEEQFTRMLSFAVTIGLIGAIYGGAPVNYMCDNLGYKNVIIIFATFGIFLSILSYWIIPNIKSQERSSVIADIKEVFSNPKVLAICFLSGLMVGPLEGFADVWGSEFFKRVYGVNEKIAASLPSTIFVGMCFGSPILSLIAEKTRSHLLTIIGSGVIMSIIFLAILFAKLPTTLITASFILVGVCCAYQILAIYKASCYVRDGVVGLTTSIANMIIMIFGYAFHSLIGLIINLSDNLNNPQSFINGILIIPLALIIGSLGFTLIYWYEKKQ